MKQLFIFWQIIPSIHESSFIRNLADRHEVIFVAEQAVCKKRIKSGWHIPDLGKTKLIISPDEEHICTLLSIANAVHIVSSIRANKISETIFDYAVKRKIKMGVLCEQVKLNKLKDKLRYLKYIYLRLRYKKYIDFILATGNQARKFFEFTGFGKNKIFDWAYFTEQSKYFVPETKNEKTKLFFVGRIDIRKNILSLVDVCKKLSEQIEVLTIVGGGPLESDLLEIIKDSRCKYLGHQPNEEVNRIMCESDLLILPSIFDGWGAVVNEALACGTPVLVSDKCGSLSLINETRGRVFSIKKNNMETILRSFLKELPYSTEKRREIREWALKNISGEAAANYFEQIIEYVTRKTVDKPVAPWLQ